MATNKVTGVRIDPELWRRARMAALEHGESASKWLERAIEAELLVERRPGMTPKTHAALVLDEERLRALGVTRGFVKQVNPVCREDIRELTYDIRELTYDIRELTYTEGGRSDG